MQCFWPHRSAFGHLLRAVNRDCNANMGGGYLNENAHNFITGSVIVCGPAQVPVTMTIQIYGWKQPQGYEFALPSLVGSSIVAQFFAYWVSQSLSKLALHWLQASFFAIYLNDMTIIRNPPKAYVFASGGWGLVIEEAGWQTLGDSQLVLLLSFLVQTHPSLYRQSNAMCQKFGLQINYREFYIHCTPGGMTNIWRRKELLKEVNMVGVGGSPWLWLARVGG